jgi:hypothetical protein
VGGWVGGWAAGWLNVFVRVKILVVPTIKLIHGVRVRTSANTRASCEQRMFDSH